MAYIILSYIIWIQVNMIIMHLSYWTSYKRSSAIASNVVLLINLLSLYNFFNFSLIYILEVWSENIWGTALQTSRSVKKEGQDVLQALELRFPAACRGAPCWSRGCLKETVELWGIHIAVVCEELQPMARTHFGKVYGGPAIIRWNRRQVWEGRSDTDVRWSYYNSHSTSLCAAWGRKMQTHEWNWAWKEGISERKVFQDLGLFLIILFWFYC